MKTKLTYNMQLSFEPDTEWDGPNHEKILAKILYGRDAFRVIEEILEELKRKGDYAEDGKIDVQELRDFIWNTLKEFDIENFIYD